MRITHEIVIDAPVDRVWELTLDVESLPSLSPTFTRVQRLDPGPLRLGSRVRVKQPGQSARIWTVTILDAPATFAWETRMLGVRMVASHELSPVDGGCRNRLTLALTGRGATLLGGLIRLPVRRAIATENAGLKQHAEQQT